MTPKAILDRPARVLGQDVREAYFRDGFVMLPAFLDDAWLERLRAAAAAFVDRSRELSESDAMFDLEPGHSAESPRLRRLSIRTPPCHSHLLLTFMLRPKIWATVAPPRV